MRDTQDEGGEGGADQSGRGRAEGMERQSANNPSLQVLVLYLNPPTNQPMSFINLGFLGSTVPLNILSGLQCNLYCTTCAATSCCPAWRGRRARSTGLTGTAAAVQHKPVQYTGHSSQYSTVESANSREPFPFQTCWLCDQISWSCQILVPDQYSASTTVHINS